MRPAMPAMPIRIVMSRDPPIPLRPEGRMRAAGGQAATTMKPLPHGLARTRCGRGGGRRCGWDRFRIAACQAVAGGMRRLRGERGRARVVPGAIPAPPPPPLWVGEAQGRPADLLAAVGALAHCFATQHSEAVRERVIRGEGAEPCLRVQCPLKPWRPAARRPYRPSPSQNSFTLAKKPSLSGLERPSLTASASNSSSSSRWRLLRFCGVSTAT